MTTTDQVLRAINERFGANIERKPIAAQVTELRNEFIRRTAKSIAERAGRLYKAATHLAMTGSAAAKELWMRAHAEFMRAKALLMRLDLDETEANAHAVDMMTAARAAA